MDKSLVSLKVDWGRIIFIVAALLMSLHFVDLRFAGNSEFSGASLTALLAGTAQTPYQYRALVPWLANGVLAVLPKAAAVAPTAVFKLFDFLAVFLFAVSFKYYISLFLKDKTQSSVLALSLFYVLPFNFLTKINYHAGLSYLPVWYPCDMPSILFFTLGLIFIYKRQWRWYYPLFLVATFNRETSCFLTAVYLFTAYGNERPRTLILHISAQIAIWGAIKLFLYRLYAGNPGDGLLLNTVVFNLNILRHPSVYLPLLSSLGFIWIPVLIYYRRIQDAFLIRALLVVIPFIVGMSCVGALPELRIYGELIPIVLAPFLLVLRDFLAERRPGEPVCET